MINIIIADDHAVIREGLKSLLRKEKIFKVVAEARDGKDLLKQLKIVSCHVVIVDLSMPNMDGLSAIKEIREAYPKIKILVLTLQKDYRHFKLATAYGASGYLVKDDACDQIRFAIKAIMHGKIYVSPAVSILLAERLVRNEDELETSCPGILTAREKQVLKLIVNGLANKNIAMKLKISARTVEHHRLNLSHKLGIKSTAGLVKYALSKGFS